MVHAGVQQALECSDRQLRPTEGECCIDLVPSVSWNGDVHIPRKRDHVRALTIGSEMHHHQDVTATLACVADVSAIGTHQHVVDRLT